MAMATLSLRAMSVGVKPCGCTHCSSCQSFVRCRSDGRRGLIIGRDQTRSGIVCGTELCKNAFGCRSVTRTLESSRIRFLEGPFPLKHYRFSSVDVEVESWRCYAKNDSVKKDKESEDASSSQLDIKSVWNVLERWNVPWDGRVTSLGMISWFLSFLMTGLVVSVAAAQLGVGHRQFLDLDDQALYVLLNQLAQTVVGLSVINNAVRPYKPLSSDLFSYDISSPFNVQHGWLLWGGVGVLCSGAAVYIASIAATSINGQLPPRDEADALLQLMPIIGASPASTASLICVTGILAPFLEETVFRGFLLPSFTKWMPTPLAVLLSAGAFAAAHLAPGEFPQLLALGLVLGFSYAQTRNLLTPILIHSVWNSGVVVILTVLRLQGYDINELI